MNHKFRVWNKKEKRYHSPYNYYFAITHTGLLLKINGDGTSSNINNDYIVEWCTGLKDKNGKLIFEGDKLSYGEIQSSYIVYFVTQKGAWCIKYDDSRFIGYLEHYCNAEITGDIHEVAK